MSREKSRFETLPNEIICCLFEFLKTSDILRAFLHLNHRYSNAVRSFVKQIDLTEQRQMDQSELRQVCKIVEAVKVDRFPRLHSLTFVNVNEWHTLPYSLNLRNLIVCFDDDGDEKNRYFRNSKPLPPSLTGFALNGALNSQYYHVNLLDLNIGAHSMIQLLEILERTPYVQRLSVHFVAYFDRNDTKRPGEYHRLTNLNSLLLTRSQAPQSGTNDGPSFQQLQLFIDRCCPNSKILKAVTLKVYGVPFSQDLWSAITRYKETYQSFHLYASFIINNDLQQIKDCVLSGNEFTFHFEDDYYRTWGLRDQRLHVYSLPFVFDQLYGFTSVTELSNQCSYSTVRHLYCARKGSNYDISLQSLGERMPHLLSINYDFGGIHRPLDKSLKIINDDDVLASLHTLRFDLDCIKDQCAHCLEFSRLFDRVPNLKVLIVPNSALRHIRHPLQSIEKLHLKGYRDETIQILKQHMPSLSILMLTDISARSYHWSHVLLSLFTELSHLTVISLQWSYPLGKDRSRYKRSCKELAHQALAELRTLAKKLEGLQLTFPDERMEFFIPSV